MLIGARKSLAALPGPEIFLPGNKIASPLDIGGSFPNATIVAPTMVDAFAPGPNGLTDADKATPSTTGNNYHGRATGSNITVAAGKHVYRMRAAPQGYRYISLLVAPAAGYTNMTQAAFDLETGQIMSIVNAGTYRSDRVGARRINNDFFRCEIELTCSANSTHRLEWYIHNITTALVNNPWVPNTTDGVLLWGAEFSPLF